MHQSTDMIAVVADPELAPNQPRNAIAGHRSVEYPWAIGPFNSSRSRRFF